jgi:hypothetical protein
MDGKGGGSFVITREWGSSPATGVGLGWGHCRSKGLGCVGSSLEQGVGLGSSPKQGGWVGSSNEARFGLESLFEGIIMNKCGSIFFFFFFFLRKVDKSYSSP